MVHSWIMLFRNKIHKMERLPGGSLYWGSTSTRSISKCCTNVFFFFSPSKLIFKPEKNVIFFCFSVFLLCSVFLFWNRKTPQNKTVFSILFWSGIMKKGARHRWFQLSCLLLFISFVALLLATPRSSWTLLSCLFYCLTFGRYRLSICICFQNSQSPGSSSELPYHLDHTNINHWAGLRCADPVSSGNLLLPQAAFYDHHNSDYTWALKKGDKSNAEPTELIKVQTASHLELKITFVSRQYELAQKLGASSLMFRELQERVSQIQQALEAIKSTIAHIMWYFCNQMRIMSLQHVWVHAHEIILTNGQNRKYQQYAAQRTQRGWKKRNDPREFSTWQESDLVLPQCPSPETQSFGNM